MVRGRAGAGDGSKLDGETVSRGRCARTFRCQVPTAISTVTWDLERGRVASGRRRVGWRRLDPRDGPWRGTIPREEPRHPGPRRRPRQVAVRVPLATASRLSPPAAP